MITIAQTINKYNIKTVIELQCSRCEWIKEILPLTKVEKYTGLDGSHHITYLNIDNYWGKGLHFDTVKPTEPLPEADLIIARDFMEKDIFDNILKTKAKYVLTSITTDVQPIEWFEEELMGLWLIKDLKEKI